MRKTASECSPAVGQAKLLQVHAFVGFVRAAIPSLPRVGHSVLGHKGLAIEWGTTMGWERYIGPKGRVIGMHNFGATPLLKAPQSKLGFDPRLDPNGCRGNAVIELTRATSRAWAGSFGRRCVIAHPFKQSRTPTRTLRAVYSMMATCRS